MTETFRFQIPSQPPSVNHTYRIVTRHGKQGQTYKTLAKEEAVLQYQMVASLQARKAKPKDWKPEGQVRIRFWFRLGRDADTDNLLKALDDAFAQAWGINDKVFLPCVVEKTTGNREPFVEVEVLG